MHQICWYKKCLDILEASFEGKNKNVCTYSGQLLFKPWYLLHARKYGN